MSRSVSTSLHLGPLHLHDDGVPSGSVAPYTWPSDAAAMESLSNSRTARRSSRRARPRSARCFVIGKRGDVVLELAQLVDEVIGDEVGPRRSDLTELHERGAEPLEGVPQPDGHGSARSCSCAQPAMDRRETAQPGDVERVIESLVGKDADDLAVSLRDACTEASVGGPLRGLLVRLACIGDVSRGGLRNRRALAHEHGLELGDL